MGSNSVPAVARQLLVALAGAVGAQAAWSAGYLASFAICCALVAWSAGHLLASRLQRGDHEAQQGRWLSALLEREREARVLAAYLDHAPVPLLAMRSRGTISALNLAARRFFSTDDLVVDAPEALMAAVLGARPGERQTLTLDSEGLPRAYALTLAELVSDSEFVRIIALVDIQAEIQAAEATALRELLQVLSHEIMNSLTPVTSLAQTAAELLREPEREGSLGQAREAVDSVARRSEGLLRFIAAYRELARLPEPRFAEVNLAGFLEDVALLFRSRWEPRGVRLVFQRPPAEPTLSMDRDLVSQALLNVLSNAAEAALETAQAPQVRLAAEVLKQGRVVIGVQDNGPGVNLPDPSMIFRPFYTTKAAGTGVGLSLARQVVLAHGGEITVGPGEGGGALIRMSF